MDSIDGLGDVTAEQYVSTTTAPAAQAVSAPTAAPAAVAAPAAPTAAAAPAAEPAAEPAVATGMTNKDDPRFSRYFKMVGMGVPLQAVKGKFAVETGCDPSILE